MRKALAERRRRLGDGNSGGLGRNRTADTRLFRALLYRLSYQAKEAADVGWIEQWVCDPFSKGNREFLGIRMKIKNQLSPDSEAKGGSGSTSSPSKLGAGSRSSWAGCCTLGALERFLR